MGIEHLVLESTEAEEAADGTLRFRLLRPLTRVRSLRLISAEFPKTERSLALLVDLVAQGSKIDTQQLARSYQANENQDPQLHHFGRLYLEDTVASAGEFIGPLYNNLSLRGKAPHYLYENLHPNLHKHTFRPSAKVLQTLSLRLATLPTQELYAPRAWIVEESFPTEPYLEVPLTSSGGVSIASLAAFQSTYSSGTVNLSLYNSARSRSLLLSPAPITITKMSTEDFNTWMGTLKTQFNQFYLARSYPYTLPNSSTAEFSPTYYGVNSLDPIIALLKQYHDACPSHTFRVTDAADGAPARYLIEPMASLGPAPSSPLFFPTMPAGRLIRMSWIPNDSKAEMGDPLSTAPSNRGIFIPSPALVATLNGFYGNSFNHAQWGKWRAGLEFLLQNVHLQTAPQGNEVTAKTVSAQLYQVRTLRFPNPAYTWPTGVIGVNITGAFLVELDRIITDPTQDTNLWALDTEEGMEVSFAFLKNTYLMTDGERAIPWCPQSLFYAKLPFSLTLEAECEDS